MSTSKHINKICIAAILITLIITIIFVNSSKFGVTISDSSLGYEERLFDNSTVHTIDIVMDDWNNFIENCESEEYSVCTAVIDGEKYSNIGIRAKGNTSLSSVKSMNSERYSLKLEFDQYEDGKSYYGLDKLCLNNLIQDNTMMKDYLAYQLMAEFGADSPLCSYVYITVNGEDWGLYLAVEGIEDSFIKRNYGSDSGNMYKPDSLSFGGGRGNGEGFDMGNFDFSKLNSEDADQAQDSVQDSVQDSSGGDMSDGQFPGGDKPNGQFSGGDKPNGQFSGGDKPNGQFSGGDMPDGQFPGGDKPDGQFPGGDKSDESSEQNSRSTKMPGGFGGMGSDDVKLKYTDDDPDSYSNIFNNAKTVVTKSDKKRLISSIKDLNDYTNLEEVLDVEEVLRYFVVHNFLVNGDSYTGSMVHNYYLYEEDGKLSMIPWDYNLAYGTFQGGDASDSVNSSIDSLVSGGDVNDRPMFGWIYSDEKYTDQYHELYSEFINEWIDSGKLEQLINDTAEMIRPYVEKDPSKFCTTEEFETGVTTILEFTSLRGEAVKRQLNGDISEVETNGLDTSAMGSMGGSMGGGFGNKRDGSSDTESSENMDFPNMDFPNMDFSDMDFSNMDFPNMDFSNMDFPNIDSSNFDSSKFTMDGKMDFNQNVSGSSSIKNWIWIGISTVILAIGLIIAKLKKW